MFRLIIVAAGAGLAGMVAASASAGDMRVVVGGASFGVPVLTMTEARVHRLVTQRYDYSCGSAAVATLLTYHYDDPVTEAEVFRAMFETGDQDKIRKEGFSLLDMKNFLEAREYLADGFQVPLESLIHASIPAIALVNTDGYRHFVVVRGISDGRVLIGDPAKGNMSLPRSQFEKIWKDQILFVIRSHGEMGQKRFNYQQDWALIPTAPYGTGVDRGALANLTLSLPTAGGF